MENQKNILDYDTVALDEAQDAVIIIDQTLLPGKIELIALHTVQELLGLHVMSVERLKGLE